MKKIEDLICKRLSECVGISELLAVYDGKPAVFIRTAPDDADAKWDGEPYPRILVDLSQNEAMERQFEQGLKLTVLTSIEQGVKPEDLETAILDSMDFCFFSRRDTSLCARWNRTEFSEFQDKKLGCYIFDIMKFQNQQVQLPDPVVTLNEWMKAAYPGAKIIGYDDMEEVWKSSEDIPAIYGRLESVTSGSYGDNWEVTWINAGIRLHIMSDRKSKSFLIRNISEKLLMKEKLIMNDGGPMFISKINYNDTMNPLKNRQFFVECQYGVLREEVEKEPIRKINIQEE
ncbi:hypothetical protein [Anaerostipes sp.]|uniref:hypothetical protein n=1 Tax=Anaerostipes sp. TaxID=1872530 RepID=UPI0025BF9531|nr:hypothetical protein [Anaerostipes sp.]MBS7007045.1 hypothetical protein [Anaerostipes sp.]